MGNRKKENRRPVYMSLTLKTIEDLEKPMERLKLSRGEVIDVIVSQWLEDRETSLKSPSQQEAVQKPLQVAKDAVEHEVNHTVHDQSILDKLDEIDTKLEQIELRGKYVSVQLANLPCHMSNEYE